MTHTIGIDIGSGTVKTVLFDHEGENHRWLAKRCRRLGAEAGFPRGESHAIPVE